MYKVSVPVVFTSVNYDREGVLNILRRTGAARVMLAIYRELKDGRVQTDLHMKELAAEIAFFEENGYEAGVWMGETIGHGWPINETSAYRNIVNVLGNTGYSAFCPTDENFANDICAWIANVARAGAKFILLDDDFRMSNHGAAGSSACCLCEKHLELYHAEAGENLSREEILHKVFSGGPSKYRAAWTAVMGKTLTDFAKKIRAAVDKVDERVRIGLCGTLSVTDSDGSDYAELTQILAGKGNKGFLRLFGAPYWAHDGYELAQIFNLERLYAGKFDREKIEIVCEGDTYPRPRFVCPAAYLEAFDQALAADGNFDGILKYMAEYAAPYNYETGYVERHAKNRALHGEILQAFSKGECAGLRLFENTALFRGATLGENALENIENAMWRRGVSLRFASALGLPVAFSGDGPAVIFGENARYAEAKDLRRGAILDAVAADILSKRGFDTGLKGMRLAENDVISTEYFAAEDAHVTSPQPVFYELDLEEGADALTFYEGKRRYVGAYRYENAEKQRFLVYAFDGDKTNERTFKMYSRQREVARMFPWLCGRKPPAACTGNPDTYTICKKSEGALAVGFWNLFADEIPEARFELAEKYTSAKWLNCEGTLEGDIVTLKNVPPFSFAGFLLKK